MAPIPFEVPPGTYDITLHFYPTDDKEITCLICGQDNCDLETTVRDRRKARITIGKHSKCVWTSIKEKTNGNT